MLKFHKLHKSSKKEQTHVTHKTSKNNNNDNTQMLNLHKSLKEEQTPHVTHKVVVKNDASGPSWRGNLKLLPSRSVRSKLLVKNDGNSHAWRGNVRLLTTESTRSLSDCESITENMSETSSEDYSDIVYSNKRRGIFSFYQRGDGSEQDPDDIPTRFMNLANQDRNKAIALVEQTVQWRNENNIDDMLNKPHVKFDICKAVIPHFFMGRDAQGHVVYVQRPAQLNMDQVQANGLTQDDLLFHAIYIQEYVWQIVEADNPRALVTSIIDAGGLCLNDLRTKQDQLELLTKMATIFDTHFPLRGHKTLIINAPSWFNMLWRLIKPVLRESTTDMIEICTKGKQQDKFLVQQLGEETSQSLPDFCWSDPQKRPSSSSNSITSTNELEMERDLRDYVMSRIQAKGERMAPVLP